MNKKGTINTSFLGNKNGVFITKISKKELKQLREYSKFKKQEVIQDCITNPAKYL